MLRSLLLIIGFCFSSIHAFDEHDKKESETHVKATYELLQKIREVQLLKAVKSGSCEKAELWLKAGANTDIGEIINGEKRYMLMNPIINHDFKMIDLLLFYKADPSCYHGVSAQLDPRVLPFKTGNLSLIKLFNLPNTEGVLNINTLCRQPDVTMYLLSRGANVNRRIGDATPLQGAIMPATGDALCRLGLKKIGDIRTKALLIPNSRQIKYLLCFGANRQLSRELTAYDLYKQIVEQLSTAINQMPPYSIRLYDDIEELGLDAMDVPVSEYFSCAARFLVPGTKASKRKEEITRLLKNGPNEQDYEDTSHDCIEASAHQPSKRGNIFKQLAHYQSGVSRQMSVAILRRKRKKDKMDVKVLADHIMSEIGQTGWPYAVPEACERKE